MEVLYVKQDLSYGNIGKNPVLNSKNLHEISKKFYSNLENTESTFWRAKSKKNKSFLCSVNFKSRG
jgi:hypothetical protein